MNRVSILVGLIPMLFGCGGPEPSQATAHVELIRTLFEVSWNTGDISGLDPRAAADSILLHYRGESRYQSLGDLQGLIAHWRSAFPDLRMEVEDLVADKNGEMVAARVRYSGTHQGEWFGVPPTGRHVDVEEMMFFRFEAGRLVEAWEVDDQLTMRTQLGLIN